MVVVSDGWVERGYRLWNLIAAWIQDPSAVGLCWLAAVEI